MADLLARLAEVAQAASGAAPQPTQARAFAASPSPRVLDGGQTLVQRVCCNGNTGVFSLPAQVVECHCSRCLTAEGQAAGITPTEFERHSGLLTAKKWYVTGMEMRLNVLTPSRWPALSNRRYRACHCGRKAVCSFSLPQAEQHTARSG
jgi:hypothetical protein